MGNLYKTKENLQLIISQCIKSIFCFIIQDFHLIVSENKRKGISQLLIIRKALNHYDNFFLSFLFNTLALFMSNHTKFNPLSIPLLHSNLLHQKNISLDTEIEILNYQICSSLSTFIVSFLSSNIILF